MSQRTTETCQRCAGRGYIPERRRWSYRNPTGVGFYARTCARCCGSGTVPAKPQGTCPKCGDPLYRDEAQEVLEGARHHWGCVHEATK